MLPQFSLADDKVLIKHGITRSASRKCATAGKRFVAVVLFHGLLMRKICLPVCELLIAVRPANA
jgi:hypothetical protein